ncbi:hypothetical protein [Mediterraneibacter agrestimuris]|uniref:hypothetical protein n=1 Tax=Mediterraneibacter agrestimuris TaxID=2941333 RepID=UPI002040D620|nr:hypothetical protein [Mediterraneibacter agrestimuris]
MITAVIVLEVVWFIMYLNTFSNIPFVLYMTVAIAIFIVGIVIWHFWSIKTVAEEKQCIKKYGRVLAKETVEKIEKDPRRRNQKRGRGPYNGRLDPESCVICGSGVRDDGTPQFWSAEHFCHDCEQRYQKALANDEIPYIAGYTDDEEYGDDNKVSLWEAMQITAIDLLDGVIDEKTARAEVASVLEKGRQWAVQRKTAKAVEKCRRQDFSLDRESKSHLNDEMQRLLS